MPEAPAAPAGTPTPAQQGTGDTTPRTGLREKESNLTEDRGSVSYGEQTVSMVDLPSREQLKTAIEPWWSGAGTAVLLVDVLRREQAILTEARAIAQRCGEIADKGYRITDELVTRELGDLRSSIYRKEIGKREDDEREIGSAAWLRRAEAIARKGWERYFPGEPMPLSNPGAYFSDEADRRYAELIRSQHDAIAETIQRNRKR